MYTKSIGDEHRMSDTAVEFPVVLLSANEDFPAAQSWDARVADDNDARTHGWSAFEIWHSHIRAVPGIKSRFLREL
jgi:hypothetical protein